jgi:hypothetical protein
MNAKAKAMNSTTENMKAISNTVPLGRFGTPDEIANVTGTELFVDGGFAQV